MPIARRLGTVPGALWAVDDTEICFRALLSIRARKDFLSTNFFENRSKKFSQSASYNNAMRLLAALVLCVSSFGLAQVTPKQGSPDRKAIMDGLRIPIEKDLKQKVIFQVDHLKLQGNWAFFSGKNLTTSGKKIDYRKTQYKEALEAGAFDDWTCALLKKNGKKWKVVTYAIGATDVVWDGWYQQYGAPKSIFPYPK